MRQSQAKLKKIVGLVTVLTALDHCSGGHWPAVDYYFHYLLLFSLLGNIFMMQFSVLIGWVVCCVDGKPRGSRWL